MCKIQRTFFVCPPVPKFSRPGTHYSVDVKLTLLITYSLNINHKVYGTFSPLTQASISTTNSPKKYRKNTHNTAQDSHINQLPWVVPENDEYVLSILLKTF